MTTCKTCGKWAGAHATLPGQSKDHLCHGHPVATQPTASNAGERDILGMLDLLIANYRDHAEVPPPHTDPWLFDAMATREEIRAAFASKPPQVEQKPYCWEWKLNGRTGIQYEDPALYTYKNNYVFTPLYTAPHPEPVAPPTREARHIATGTDLEWQAKIFHEEMDKLGVPRDDGEDFYSLIGRTNLALSATPPAQAVQDKEDDWSVEAAAMKLAEVMDYPWINMPDEGRMRMRRKADAVVRAALTSGNGVAPS